MERLGYPCDVERILARICASNDMPELHKHKYLGRYVASIVPRHIKRAVVGVHGGDSGYGVRSGGVAVSYGIVVEVSQR